MEINLNDKIEIQTILLERRILKDPLVGFYDRLDKAKEQTKGVDSFKQFLGVYECIRREFLEDAATRAYGVYCGALYGLHLLNGAAGKFDTRSLVDFNLNFDRKDYFFVRDLINSYLDIAERTTRRNLDRTTGIYLVSVGKKSKDFLENRIDGLSRFDDLKVVIGDYTIKGIENDFEEWIYKQDSQHSQEQIIQESKPVTVEKISFDEIGGNKKAKKEARRLVEMIKDPAVLELFGIALPRGILFYGPPGTGKTLLAKAIASEAGLPFYEVSCNSILSKYVGESEQRLAAMLSNKNCIYFLDEFDSLGRNRDDENVHQVYRNIVNILATIMDGISTDNADKRIFIASVNDLGAVDKKLRRSGRFDKVIRFYVPDREDLKEIFQIHMQKVQNKAKIENLFRQVDLDAVVDFAFRKTEQLQERFGEDAGIVGADVAEIIKRVLEDKVEIYRTTGRIELPKSEDFFRKIESYEFDAKLGNGKSGGGERKCTISSLTLKNLIQKKEENLQKDSLSNT